VLFSTHFLFIHRQGPRDASKLLDAANQAVRENPAFGYIWKAGGAIAVTALGLGLQVYRMNEKIHNVEVQVTNVEKGLNEKIHNVEVQVTNVEKGLNEKIHNVEVKLKDELHGQLGQVRGELSNMRASMERSEDKLSAQIEKTNQTLAQLLKKLP
jgi:biopolymer transport protein ExbB/TolQ